MTTMTKCPWCGQANRLADEDGYTDEAPREYHAECWRQKQDTNQTVRAEDDDSEASLENEYASEITGIIDRLTGNAAEYPDTFDADVHACWLKRMPAEQAAHELAAAWFGTAHCNTATSTRSGWTAC